jgi:hypothetical protein
VIIGYEDLYHGAPPDEGSKGLLDSGGMLLFFILPNPF